MNVLVAQIGARRHYAVPVALYRAGLLHSVCTDWCANRGVGALVTAIVPRGFLQGPLRRIRDRRIPHMPASRVKTLDGHAVRMAPRRLRRRSQDQYLRWAEANRDFGECLVRRGFDDADAVYGFNAAAVELFRYARQRGLKTILDQTIAPWRYAEALLAEERVRWPDWEDAASEGWRVLADRESEEWELADGVICGSDFVVESLHASGGRTEQCRVVPYGYDAPSVSVEDRQWSKRPLRVLFVGTIELRKGVPYLLEAARQLCRTVEVRMVGPIRVKDAAIALLREHVDLYGPVSRSQVHRHYQWADLFVLPTLVEGSANVCYEAMSHALPVITTPNAGSVVRDGLDGFLIAPRSTEQLMDRLSHLIDNRDALERMSASAAARAAHFSWSRYHDQLPIAVRDVLRRPSLTREPLPSTMKVR